MSTKNIVLTFSIFNLFLEFYLFIILSYIIIKNMFSMSILWFQIDFKDDKFFCNVCDIHYKIKDSYPILINFDLENVLIKENEIRIKKKIKLR